MITIHFPTGKRARIKRAEEINFTTGGCELKSEDGQIVAVMRGCQGYVFETSDALVETKPKPKRDRSKILRDALKEKVEAA